MFELIPMNRHLTRGSFDPFREMEEFERSFLSGANSQTGIFRTDVIDTGDAFSIESELPGFSKEDIDIDINNDCLTITATRKADESEEGKNYIRRERIFGSFSRSFDVSGVTVDAIEASFNDGILKLHLPKKPENVPVSRKLEIM